MADDTTQTGSLATLTASQYKALRSIAELGLKTRTIAKSDRVAFYDDNALKNLTLGDRASVKVITVEGEIASNISSGEDHYVPVVADIDVLVNFIAGQQLAEFVEVLLHDNALAAIVSELNVDYDANGNPIATRDVAATMPTETGLFNYLFGRALPAFRRLVPSGLKDQSALNKNSVGLGPHTQPLYRRIQSAYRQAIASATQEYLGISGAERYFQKVYPLGTIFDYSFSDWAKKYGITFYDLFAPFLMYSLNDYLAYRIWSTVRKPKDSRFEYDLISANLDYKIPESYTTGDQVRAFTELKGELAKAERQIADA